MSLTDNKILSADLTGKKVIDKADDFNTDPDVTKAWFDEYPDVIVTKYNALVDDLDDIAGMVTVPNTIAAATSNKGTYTGNLPIGALVTILFANGNTASSPTITIGGDELTFSGIPTTAKLSGSTYQTYKFVRTSNTLVFLAYPSYTCEYGTSGNWQYERKASGHALCFNTTSNSSGTITMTLIANESYKSGKLTLALPTGLFNAVNYTVNPSIFSESYIDDIAFLYDECTSDTLKYMVKKGGSSDAAVSFRATVNGKWR